MCSRRRGPGAEPSLGTRPFVSIVAELVRSAFYAAAQAWPSSSNELRCGSLGACSSEGRASTEPATIVAPPARILTTVRATARCAPAAAAVHGTAAAPTTGSAGHPGARTEIRRRADYRDVYRRVVDPEIRPIATDTMLLQAMAETNRLQTTGEQWLRAGFKGIGNAGDVGGKKVRYYSGTGFTHSFHGYEAARHRFGKDYGEALASAESGAGSRRGGLVGLVGEKSHGEQQSLVCEIFDLATGSGLVLTQPFRKSFFSKKEVGPLNVSEPEALTYVTTDPRITELVAALTDRGTQRLAERKGEISGAGLNLKVRLSKRGGERSMWDAYLLRFDGKLLPGVTSLPVWQDDSALADRDAFMEWLDQQIDAAIAGTAIS